MDVKTATPFHYAKKPALSDSDKIKRAIPTAVIDGEEALAGVDHQALAQGLPVFLQETKSEGSGDGADAFFDFDGDDVIGVVKD